MLGESVAPTLPTPLPLGKRIYILGPTYLFTFYITFLAFFLLSIHISIYFATIFFTKYIRLCLDNIYVNKLITKIKLKMSKEINNMKLKRFVIRKSLIGKNVVITFQLSVDSRSVIENSDNSLLLSST